METKHDGRELKTIDEMIIHDIDLSILGKSWPVFLRYDSQIAEEYASIDRDIYLDGRIKVMQSFVDRDKIYKMSTFRDKYEKNARENVSKLIVKLKADKEWEDLDRAEQRAIGCDSEKEMLEGVARHVFATKLKQGRGRIWFG